ncbi:MAG: hypothetical protein SVR08_06800 [Spirochaetota bacterium]|nr:hypothetical protein [Spirochaetota bacterium]
MEVQINNCPVSFELENEKTVSDVIESMNEWIKERALVFTNALIDEKSYFIDDLPDIPISNVKQINCIVRSSADVVISSLNEGIDYCVKVKNFMDNSIKDEKPDLSQKESLIEGTTWLIDVLNSVIMLLSMDAHEIKYKDKKIAEYLNELDKFNDIILTKKDAISIIELFKTGKNLFVAFENIFRMMLVSDELKSLIYKSIDSPDSLVKSLFEIKENIPIQLNNLEETACAFQVGKDYEASEKLQAFTDFIFKYSRTILQIASVFEIDLKEIIVNDFDMNEKNAEIHNLLSEIVNVMENNDIINLSDILEYEMKPLIEDLEQYIDEVLEIIQ